MCHTAASWLARCLMSRRQKDPLRALGEEERRRLGPRARAVSGGWPRRSATPAAHSVSTGARLTRSTGADWVIGAVLRGKPDLHHLGRVGRLALGARQVRRQPGVDLGQGVGDEQVGAGRVIPPALSNDRFRPKSAIARSAGRSRKSDTHRRDRARSAGNRWQGKRYSVPCRVRGHRCLAS